MLKIKNETLMNQNFSSAMQRICSMVWGRKTDEEIFRVLDLVTEKQNSLNRLYKKYLAESGAMSDNRTQESINTFNENWGPVYADESEIAADVVTLTLKGETNVSGMDRFVVKEVFNIAV